MEYILYKEKNAKFWKKYSELSFFYSITDKYCIVPMFINKKFNEWFKLYLLFNPFQNGFVYF